MIVLNSACNSCQANSFFMYFSANLCNIFYLVFIMMLYLRVSFLFSINHVFLTCSGLLSEKPDDTLFFLDVGQAKKVEQKGKYELKLLNCFQFDWDKKAYWLPLLSCSHTVYQRIYYVNLLFCAVEEPVTGKKRKGKDSRPLRIDLILQHDSLVPPPKESVFVTTSPQRHNF